MRVLCLTNELACSIDAERMSLRRAAQAAHAAQHYHSDDCHHSHAHSHDTGTADETDDSNTTIADPTVTDGDSVLTNDGSGTSDETENAHNGCLSRLAKSAEQTIALSHDEYRAKTVNQNATYSGNALPYRSSLPSGNGAADSYVMVD